MIQVWLGFFEILDLPQIWLSRQTWLAHFGLHSMVARLQLAKSCFVAVTILAAVGVCTTVVLIGLCLWKLIQCMRRTLQRFEEKRLVSASPEAETASERVKIETRETGGPEKVNSRLPQSVMGQVDGL